MDAKALLLGSLCLAAPFADAATLDNALSACLAARLGAPHTAEGQLHLPLTLEARRSTGECGCTSALVRDIGCWPCMPMRRHRSFRKVCSTVATKAPVP